jgi:hypothetical protein
MNHLRGELQPLDDALHVKEARHVGGGDVLDPVAVEIVDAVVAHLGGNGSNPENKALDAAAVDVAILFLRSRLQRPCAIIEAIKGHLRHNEAHAHRQNDGDRRHAVCDRHT